MLELPAATTGAKLVATNLSLTHKIPRPVISN
jgi:hypothetical protein